MNSLSQSHAVTSVKAQLFRLPLEEGLSDAKHRDHTYFEVVTEMVTRANSSDGMQELYAGLMSGLVNSGWLEGHSFPIDTFTLRPLVVDDHLAVASSLPGAGVAFDWEKLNTVHQGA